MTSASSNADTVHSYLAGRLSETECDAFETQLLTNVDLVRDLEESLRLREGLEILRERRELPVLASPSWRAPLPRWAAACAAAFAIIVLSVTFYSLRRSPVVIAASVAALRVHDAAPLAVVAHYTFAATREATHLPNISLPSSGALELRALTPVADVPRTFHMTLEETRAQKEPLLIGSAQHLAPDADGFVAIYADASKLRPGEYSLWVEPDGDATAQGERFTFGLTRP